MASNSAIESVQKEMLDKVGTKTFPKKRTGGSDLSKDAFLRLLTTQLRYQNPLEPTNDKEFLAQMAQFTALEQMNNLNSAFQMNQASAMINKNVEAEIKNEENGEITKVEGKVIAVNVKENKPYLVVQELNGKQREVLLDSVKTVSDGTTLDAEVLSKQLERLQVMQMNMLLNKQVTAEITEKAGKETKTTKIEGKVVGFNFDRGKQNAIVRTKDGKEQEVELAKIKLVNDGTTKDAEFLANKITELTKKVAELEQLVQTLKRP